MHAPTQSGQANVNVGQPERWLSSIAGGLLTFYGLRRLDLPGTFVALLGADLLYRGISGRSLVYKALGISTSRREVTLVAIPQQAGTRVRRSMTINRSPEELYSAWHDIGKAPSYMMGVENVQQTDAKTSHWTARLPSGKKLQWYAEFTQEQPGQLLEWRVLGKKFVVAQAGRVYFVPASDGRGTIVTLELDYPSPRNFLRKNMKQVISYLADKEALEDLRRFKELMEAGEIATIKGQPKGTTKRQRQ
ncbi:hypothetical protein KSF_048070 [Reticulibacter mediterranei]|uniref:Inner membrane protein YgaP-like transmembrane domain-containing protein n=2 Tax=Reticulibacter mediterranei TaxID=2778369 RepID=A0A8J3INE7_9CHLR|nr:hypothetical protein KSF_048070 [Reticulibacter mediterranei]